MGCPDWLPDWRDPEQYPSQLTPRQWAWEFLRRNPDYQRDYERYLEYLNPAVDKITPETPVSRYRICDPPALPEETEGEYEKRLLSAGCKTLKTCNPAVWFGEKHGLSYIIPPETKSTEQSFAAVFLFGPIRQYGAAGIEGKFLREGRGVVRAESDTELWLKFDLSKPIEPQLRRAKKRLQGAQQYQGISVRKGSPHTERLPVYLRLLDGEAANCGVAEMSRVLYPDSPKHYLEDNQWSAARKALDRAKAIRDGGYRALAAID